MAKKEKKTEKVKTKPTKREVPHIDAFLNLEGRVLELEQRIDRIVVAHTKCKSLKGM